MKIRIHNYLTSTEVNGPGKRFAIWFQGCKCNCDGCFNPETHSLTDGYDITIDNLMNIISKLTDINGITISGGEPFLQVKELLEFVTQIRDKTRLSILLFTSFTLSELEENKLFSKVLDKIDILISGKFIKKLQIENPLISSSNQELHFLSERYTINEINSGNCEIFIDKSGNITLTGTSKI